MLLDGLRGVGVPLLIVRCEVPLELALERAARRLGDPRRVSDATPQIAEEQFRSFEDLDERSEGTVLRLDAAQALDVQIAEIARAVDRRGLGGPGPRATGGRAGSPRSVETCTSGRWKLPMCAARRKV